jgi:hypothetical protein
VWWRKRIRTMEREMVEKNKRREISEGERERKE